LSHSADLLVKNVPGLFTLWLILPPRLWRRNNVMTLTSDRTRNFVAGRGMLAQPGGQAKRQRNNVDGS